MKNCPRCSFLMDDHEAICGTCVDQERERRSSATSPMGAPPLRAGGTAVLDRPTVVPLSESATFRTPGSGGVSTPTVVVCVLLAVALTAGVVLGLRHQGPLAAPLQQLGVIDPPVVVVPDRWRSLSSPEAGFSVSMPANATDAAEDPELVQAGMTGYQAELGPEGVMRAVSTDLGRGPEGLRDLDTDAGFASLIDLYVSAAGLGQETVRREVQVSHGRAADSVLVLDDDYTTRARFMMTGGRFVVLLTGGDDSGAAALDEAHPKMVDSFEPT